MIRHSLAVAGLSLLGWTLLAVLAAGLWSATHLLRRMFAPHDDDPILTTAGWMAPADLAARIRAMIADSVDLTADERQAFHDIVEAERARSMRQHPSQWTDEP